MDVNAELERFRSVIQKDWDMTEMEGRKVHADSRLSSIVIACRHFATGGDLPAYELLRIASEVTGIPLEQMHDKTGRRVTVWRPARGEVGWLPYAVPPQNWTGGDWMWDGFTQDWRQMGSAITTAPVGA